MSITPVSFSSMNDVVRGVPQDHLEFRIISGLRPDFARMSAK